MTNRLVAAALAVGLVVTGGAATRSAEPRAVDSLQDRRLDPPKTLDDVFLFTLPESPAAWAARASVVRRQIQVAVGLWPMPDSTPLNAVIHGRVARDGYTVDKVYFESLPGHFVTGSLYRPAGRQGRLPAVLLPHGHWPGGRFNEATVAEVRHSIVTGAERFEVGGRYPLQAAAAQLARMGVVSFLFDLEGYADSVQIPIGVAHGGPHGRPKDSPASPGLFFSAAAESRLQSIMGLQSWNARRALDFLVSLPDVDPARLAVSGASGGGTQTFILGALDDRPATLYPMVMVGTRMQGGCTCENADYLRIGTGNVEIAGLWAPRPLGMTTADDWTKTMPETGFPALQKLWAMLGAKDAVQIFPLPQFPHNYNYVSRATLYAWLNKHLALGLADPVVEEDFVPLTRQEASVWDAEHPAPKSGDAEERRVTSWWTTLADRQMAALRPRDSASLAEYRDVVGGALAVMLGRDVPAAEDITVRWSEGRLTTGGTTSQSAWLVQNRWSETTPVTVMNAEGRTLWQDVAVWVSADGKKGLRGPGSVPRPGVASLLAAGVTVVGLDVFGTEDTATSAAGPARNVLVDGPPVAPYTYGYNSPLIIEHVHDVLAALRFARTKAAGKVYLVGFGKDAGVWAALARSAASSLVDRAAIDTGGFRFRSVTAIDDPMMLPGGAKYDDLPGLLSLGAPGLLWLAGEGARPPDVVAAAYRAAGARGAIAMSTATSAQVEAAAVRWITSAN
jgi:hypothetical protein